MKYTSSATHRAVAVAIILVWLVALLGLGACTPKDSTPETPSEKTVVVAYPVDIKGVNELINQSTAIHNGLLYFGLFLPLVEVLPGYEDGPAQFGPRLAESYEFSEDRLELTFHLRKNVQWSDGEPVDADDVLFTWRAQMSPEVAWNFVDAKKRIDRVEKLDDHTVRFYFHEAYATQINEANLGVILPEHVWGQRPFSEWRSDSDWFVENLVVNGPFELESWEPQQRFVLKRNENYFEPGLPKVDRIVFEITRDAQSQIAKLRSGHAQMVEYVNPPDAQIVLENPELRLETFIPRFFYFLMWNISRPLFAEAEVRQALTMAIDRQNIIDTLHFGYGSLAYSPFPSNSWAHNKNIDLWPYDPERAQQLLAEQGWRDRDGDGLLDRDGQVFRFELLTNSENPLRRDITVMIQEQLRRIGIAAETRHMEFNALIGPLTQHEFDAVVTGVAIDTSFNTRFHFHTSAVTEGYNWGVYENPEVDRLIEEIEQSVDPVESKKMFDRLQEILRDDLPVTYLYEGRRLVGLHESLRDVKPNAINSFSNMRFWRLEEGDSAP